MYRRRIFLWLLLFSLLMSLGWGLLDRQSFVVAQNTAIHSSKSSDRASVAQSKAPLLNNLGDLHHPISTDSAMAQRYFDQGLTLAYGFNHAEAARSFQTAARLDPDCAICYWGMALVSGPNINAPMTEDAVPQAWQALQKAIALSQQAPEVEKAYIEALARRYSAELLQDRSQLDRTYAKAMGELHQRYPDDLDAATLYAEALMDTTPWDYWEENGEPKPEGVEIMKTLEAILEKNPNHPGANHLYIHAVEKERPELGIPAADRLGNLAPGAGHLVHMPSHIYIRVGRYHDAVVANQKAIAADRDYITQCHDRGLYPLLYMPHNQHFLWFGAIMTGQSEVALEAATNTAKVEPTLMRDPAMAGGLQHFYSVPLYTLTRFGKWKEILAKPAPAEDLKYANGVWHYARGMALLGTDRVETAQEQLNKLQAIAADPALAEVKIWDFNSTGTILNIATEVLAGKIAARQQDYDGAIAHLEKAIDLEDSLIYTEPADWYHPVRQVLAAVLLAANRPAEAAKIYQQDLDIYPENGWSLYGLTQSLEAQGKVEEAKRTHARWQKAWQYADKAIAL